MTMSNERRSFLTVSIATALGVAYGRLRGPVRHWGARTDREGFTTASPLLVFRFWCQEL
jgi:hypothetical protein